MKELMNQVEVLTNTEYSRASHKYGPTHYCDHQAYAVLLEEFQEAEQEKLDCESALDKLWQQIKLDRSDSTKRGILRSLELHAQLAACEFIQVAAMAKKALLTIERRNTNDISRNRPR